MSQRDRRILFLVLCIGCILTVVIFGLVGRWPRGSQVTSLGTEPKAAISDLKPPAPDPQTPTGIVQPGLAPRSEEPTRSDAKNGVRAVAKNIPAEPASKTAVSRLLYFRSNATGDGYGKLAVAPLDALEKVHYSREVSCERVHFGGGNGICLTGGVAPDQRDKIGPAFRSWLTSSTGYSAMRFDDRFRPGWNIKLNGIPSRVRVSPSGRLGAITVFLSGHSYAALSFATQTTIVDVVSGKVLTDLETFAVTRNGEAFKSPDFNFWGTTFGRDDNHFYATLWSTGKTYLVECDLEKRTATVVYEGVECPSLSPDKTHIAFKRRTGFIGGPITWRISLLDLKTLTDRPLGETRNIDDQVEWLDNDRILYAVSTNEKGSGTSTDIWVLPTGADGSPRLWLKDASSPAVVPDAR